MGVDDIVAGYRKIYFDQEDAESFSEWVITGAVEKAGGPEWVGQVAHIGFQVGVGGWAAAGGKVAAARRAAGLIDDGTRILDDVARIVDDIPAPGKGLTNPLPEDGAFSRVMPREYAEAFARGEGPIAGGTEVWVGAADDLTGITTRRGAQSRLALFTDVAGTKPDLAGDVIVKFRIKDIQKVGLRSPTEFGKLRNYGFTPGGRTGGGAREWLINNGTKGELGIYDIILEGLKK